MKAIWKLIDTGIGSAEGNMAFDIQMLESFANESTHPILHFYDWKLPSITYGYFINPESLLRIDQVNDIGLDLARRPTGGGIIFHVSDFAFSILVPANHSAYSVNILDNYAYVNSIVIDVIKKFLGKKNLPILLPKDECARKKTRDFCMAKPTKYDVMLGGRKIGGGAQRRMKNGFLHQGTISISLPNEELLSRVLISGASIIELMRRNTYSILPENSKFHEIEKVRNHLKATFKEILELNF